MKTFTELKNGQSITIAYDGLNPIPPMFCYLKPYYNDPNKSYFRQIAEELRTSYEVAYYPSNRAKDETFRKIVIRTKAEGVKVREKTGYFAR